MEIEYKFYIDAEQKYSEILEDEIWDNYKSTPWTKHHFFAKYYDTPNSILGDNGLAFRVRKEDDIFVFTAKAPGKLEGELSHRQEWNFPWQDAPLDLNFLLNEISEELNDTQIELIRQADRVGISSELATDITRYISTLRYKNALIEVVVDMGTLYGGKLSEACYEMELELISGEAEDLVEIANKIKSYFNLAPGIENKMARCVRLKKESDRLGL